MLKTLLVMFCFATPHVVDGDTFKACGVSIRLSDYDAPELFHARCARERRLAEYAKVELARRLPTLRYHLVACATHNYGRLCAFAPGLASEMISRGLASPYPPGKRDWCS